MTIIKAAVTVTVLIAVAAAVGACREQEQDRTLLYDKGKYTGKPDEALNEETLRRLRERQRGQAFGGV